MSKINIPVAPVDLEDDGGILNFAIGQRLGIAAQMVQDANGNLPQSEERLNIYMQNLNGIEKIALSRMKIKSDERNNQTSAEATAAIVAAVLKNIQPNDNPYVVIDNPPQREAPMLPADIIDVEPVPGQMVIGNESQMDIDTFMASFEKDE